MRSASPMNVLDLRPYSPDECYEEYMRHVQQGEHHPQDYIPHANLPRENVAGQPFPPENLPEQQSQGRNKVAASGTLKQGYDLETFSEDVTMRNIRDLLQKVMNTKGPVNTFELDGLLGIVLMHIGDQYMENEINDSLGCEEVLQRAIKLLELNSLRPETAFILIRAYSQMGQTLYTRGNYTQGIVFSLKSNSLYELYRPNAVSPMSPYYAAKGIEVSEDMRLKELDYNCCINLYHLRKMYDAVGARLKSLICRHLTLKKELSCDYGSLTWWKRAMEASDYFVEFNGFYQARNHLAAANLELERLKHLFCSQNQRDNIEFFNYEVASAEINYAWIKYCLKLMDASILRIKEGSSLNVTDMSHLNMMDASTLFRGEMQELVFTEIATEEYETMVPYEYLITYGDISYLFVHVQELIAKAKTYYTKRSNITRYMDLILDSSQSYSHLAFFECDEDRKTKHLQTRAIMLAFVLEEVDLMKYSDHAQRIWFDMQDIYTELLKFKIKLMNEYAECPPELQCEINSLGSNVIQYCTLFLYSTLGPSMTVPDSMYHNTDESPTKLRQLIIAFMHLALGTVKRFTNDDTDKYLSLKRAKEVYQTVIDLCSFNRAAAKAVPDALAHCKRAVADIAEHTRPQQ